MSYTDFEIRTDDIKVSGRGMMNPKVSVTVTVTNTGDTYAGKEVVQIYASCPQGELVKRVPPSGRLWKNKTAGSEGIPDHDHHLPAVSADFL